MNGLARTRRSARICFCHIVSMLYQHCPLGTRICLRSPTGPRQEVTMIRGYDESPVRAGGIEVLATGLFLLLVLSALLP